MRDEQNFVKDINVPRKEQIIIDGVDVSECAFHYQNKEGKHKCFKGDVVAICDGTCSYGAIYLKEQLARKTQECEELKEQLQANQPTGICETCMANAILQNDKYRKALEEIKEIVKINCEEICGRKFEDCNDFLCPSKNIIDIINKMENRNDEN